MPSPLFTPISGNPLRGPGFRPPGASLALASLAALGLLFLPVAGSGQSPFPNAPAAPQQQQAPQQQPHNAIAAVVEHRIITYQDVRSEAARLVDQVRRASRNEYEFHQRMRELESEIIQSKIDRVLIVKAFEEKGYQIPDSFIEHEINEILVREFDGDRSRLLSHLREHGMSMRDFREETREEIIVGYMRSQMRRSEAVVSPVRIEEYYEQNEERFRREESIHLRLIHLTGETADQLQDRIDTVMRKLEEGEDFADVARDHSRDRRRREGGSWGWINVSDLRSDWREVAASLEPGNYSDPIDAGESGAYILFVEDRREAGIAPLREVREEIEETLVSRMARDSQERWLERLRRDAFVRYF